MAIPHWQAPTWERTQHYLTSLRAAGAECVKAEADTLPAGVQGLLLAGGVDVDPRLYGERRGPETDRPHRQRDAHERGLLLQALDRDLPVLAICRGHQLLNVALGGRLLQHIDGDGHRAMEDGESRWHDVRLEGGGRLAAVYGTGAVINVNSRHHQAVTPERLAPGLEPVVFSPDGLVEGVESPGHRWVVGVQWHPERPEMHPDSDTLFEAFVRACRM